MFDSSDDESSDEETKAKRKEAAAKKKAEMIARNTKTPKKIDKSQIVFDVKVYDQEEDLEVLYHDITQIKKDGLTWNKNFEEREVAFGMMKLTMVMVVEDEKIGVDELYEEITLMINGKLDEDDWRI